MTADLSPAPAPRPRRRGPGAVIALHDRIFGWCERWLAPWLLPTLARLAFAAVLLGYYWSSARSKLGEGLFGAFRPSPGAYAQILPQKAEAVLYDPGQFSLPETLLVVAGTWAEFLLPLLIVVGLFTRLAAAGMIGFVTLQSLTDIHGHGADPMTIGAWFDRTPDSLILDQRAFWVFVLLTLVLRGGGPISVDRALGMDRRAAG
ncbi:DoxX family protein [Tropicimonas sp. IMCC34043]|uniref:DoxX family protein n=1 Tax=Tropicimonas sp. IMCC34043 TaxID=2248760 RepID=UPI000E23C59D|nr:DoxX family protein [Tropicimonas sp. IMCC34043]